MKKLIYPVIVNEKSLPIYLTGIGMNSPEGHVKRSRGLISHQFLYTASGSGTLILDGEKYTQKQGSCFYLPPSIPHEYFPKNENEQWETCWIVFRGDYLNQIMHNLGFEKAEIRNFLVLEPLAHIFDLIFKSAKNPYNSGYQCSLLLYEYILQARKLFFEEKGQFVQQNMIEVALEIIDHNLSRDISLEELAKSTKVSQQHFCRIFKAQIGLRPMEYIAQKRIAFAKVLLENSDKSIREIGELSGYPNPTYFGVVFKKYEGVSPKEYRKYRHLLRL